MNHTSPPIAFYKHSLLPEDHAAVLHVLQSDHLTTGRITRQFEEKFATYLGRSFVVGVTNGTSALFLALLACGIGPNDEVITTPMTFVSTANAILHTGAKPIFVDVDPTTGLLDLDRLEGAISPRTRAVIPVHLYGQMVDMKRLSQLCKKHHLSIIEDAAHAIEASRDGIRPGDLSDAVCYSFYATKNLTCGEGGAIATDHAHLYHNLQQLRLHGITRPLPAPPTDFHPPHDPALPAPVLYPHWDMMQLGYKMNLSDILSALLVHQLDRLEQNWHQRYHLAQRYHNALSGISGIHMPATVPNSRHGLHLFPIQVPAHFRDQTLFLLQQQNIGVAVHYRAIHLLSYYQQIHGSRAGQFPCAEQMGHTVLSLPFYPGLQPHEQDTILKTLEQIATLWFNKDDGI